MELDFLRYIGVVCNDKSVYFILIVSSGFQIEANTEYALRSICACPVGNNCLSIADENAFIIRHVDGVCARLYLVSNRLTLEEVQREQQIRNLSAFAQELDFCI